MEPHRLVIPYGMWKRQVFLGLFVLLFVGVVWASERQSGWPCYLVFSLFAVALSFCGETEIDRSRAVIIRRWSLLKIIPLRCKRYTVSDFTSVGARFKDDGEGDRMWYVHLQEKTGRRLELKWFGPAKELPVEAFHLQTRLADLTGLPIKNEIH